MADARPMLIDLREDRPAFADQQIDPARS